MSSVAVWDEWNSSGGPKYPHEKIVQYTFRHLKPAMTTSQPFKVLDLGCGCGVHSHFLFEEGFHVSGCDISPTAIANTKALLTHSKYNCSDFVVSNVSRLPYKDSTFDALISVGVLDCAGYGSFKDAFSEIVRVLKASGMAILIFAAKGDFRLNSSPHLSLYGFTEQQLRELAEHQSPYLSYCHFDKYITTYLNKKIMQIDHLITLQKK